MQSNMDPGLLLLNGKDGAVMCMFYVDDGLAVAICDKEAEALVDLVISVFAIRRIREPEDVLGIEVWREWDASTITPCHGRKALACPCRRVWLCCAVRLSRGSCLDSRDGRRYSRPGMRCSVSHSCGSSQHDGGCMAQSFRPSRYLLQPGATREAAPTATQCRGPTRAPFQTDKLTPP